MGFQQVSPSSPRSQRATSPPSAAGNKGRRPNTLSVSSTSLPSKTSPTSRVTGSPSSGKSSPARSPAPKRTVNASKGSSPTGKPTTTVCQAPVLATEARSRVRPCGCSRRHGGHHHHAATHPEPTKDTPRRRVKAQTPPARQDPATSPSQPAHRTPSPASEKAVSTKTGNNRYVSTLVWVPRHHPHKFSTTLVVSTDQPTFTDVIYIKQNGECVNAETNLDEARKH